MTFHDWIECLGIASFCFLATLGGTFAILTILAVGIWVCNTLKRGLQ
jgi:hypothetical protein